MFLHEQLNMHEYYIHIFITTYTVLLSDDDEYIYENFQDIEWDIQVGKSKNKDPCTVT